MATKRRSLIGRELLGSSAGIQPLDTKSRAKSSEKKPPEKKQTAPSLYEELSTGNGDSCPVILADDRETGLVLSRIAGSVSRVILTDAKKVTQTILSVKERYPDRELVAACSQENSKMLGVLKGKGISILDAIPRNDSTWAAVKDAQGLDAAKIQFNQAVELARLLERVRARIMRGRIFQPLDANTILNTDYGSPLWAIDQLIPAGVTLFASRPKKGKSWLALQMARAVAQGKPFMGLNTKRGAVFYAALEDTPRRLKQRMQALGADELNEAERGNLLFTTSFPALDLETGIPELAQIIIEKKPSLVIFDVWRRCQPEIKDSGLNAQQKDYRAIFPLTCLAAETNTPILVLTHQNKQASKAGEMLDGVADSLGLSGAVDGIITLNRDGQSETAFLKKEGREYENSDDIHIAWQKGGGWRLATAQEVKDKADAAEGETKRKIRQALEGSDSPLSFTEIVNVTNLGRGTVCSALARMKEIEAVIQDVNRKYRLNPALSSHDTLSKHSLNNNNNNLVDTVDTLDTLDTLDTVDTIRCIRADTGVDTKVDTVPKAVKSTVDANLYPEYPEYPRNAQNRNTAVDVSRMSLPARLAPFYPGQDAEMIAKSLAAGIVDYQRATAEIMSISKQAAQYEQGVFPLEENDSEATQ